MAKINKIGKFNRLSELGYTQEQEARIYDEDLQMVFMFPRQVLDGLDKFSSYRVSWHNYHHKTPVLPLKFIKNRNLYK